MCGIAGIVDLHSTRDIDRAALSRMSDALRHRGPDGDGFMIEPGIGFAHRRLAIIDIEGGKQPFESASGGACLTYNGEIYNFASLRQDLEATGHQFRTRSDTEVLAELLDARGADALPALRGMFAFAAWDRRSEILTLARDRLGEKPLYYAETFDGFLLFASEIDALIASGLVGAELRDDAVADYLMYGYVPDPKSIYRDIHKLRPGHHVIHRRGRRLSPQKQWWAPKIAPREGCAFEAMAEELLPRLDSAVEAQMVADVPVASFLSGGVDSSAVTASMVRSSDGPPRTCVMGFDDPAFDERRPARKVADHLGTDHQEWVADLDPLGMVPAIAAIYGEPFADTSALPTILLCRGARERATVALSGDGGDEVFAGYGRYDGIAREDRLRRIVPSLFRATLFRAAGHFYPQLPPSAPKALRLRTAFQAIGEDAGSGYARAVSAVLPDRCATLLSGKTAGYRPQTVVLDAMAAADLSDPVLSAQAADLVTWLPGRMLVKTDRASMAAGLEVRPPMLDHQFVDWAGTLPRQMKLSGGVGKKILKAALESRLPEDILYRQKQGFGAPVDSWFDDADNRLGKALFSRTAWQDSGYFAPDAVKRTLEAHRSGKRRHGQELWSILMFDAFLTRKSADRALIPQLRDENQPLVSTAAMP